MSSSPRQRRFSILGIGASFTLAPATAFATDSVEVFFTTPTNDIAAAESASTVGAIEQGVLSSIGAATTSIDAAIYELDRTNIINALIDAKKNRSVSVRVVAECENRLGADKPNYDLLAAAGIPIVHDGSSFNGTDPNCPDGNGGTMHDKFMIFDGGTVWTGSVNYTSTGFNYNREHAVKVVSASIAGQYAAEFATMFGNGVPLENGGTGRFSRSKYADGTSSNIVVHNVNGVTVQTAFSPRGYNNTYTSSKPTGPDTMKLLRTGIFSASGDLRFAIFFLNHSQIRSDLVARSAFTNGIMDAVGAMDSGSQFGALSAGGIPVKNENFPGKVHHKLLVADAGTTSDPQTVVGSTNWTSSAFSFNDENMLLIHSATIASAARSEVTTLYNDPANVGMEACGHTAEAFNASSPVDLQGRVAVCNDANDNDFNGLIDAADAACGRIMTCCGASGAVCATGGDCCSGTCFNGNPKTCK